MKFLLLTCVLPLVGCTDSFNALSKDKNARKGTPIVSIAMNNVQALPLCTSTTEGLSAFLAKDGLMYRCERGSWFAVKTQDHSWGFKTRSTVRYNQWEDLTARKRWAIAPAQTELANSCGNGWRLPAKDELLKASENGLYDGIKSNGGTAFARAWTNDKTMVPITQTEKDNEAVGVYCVMDT